jgi:hypothetical protein
MSEEPTIYDYTRALKGDTLTDKVARFLSEQMNQYVGYDKLSPEMKEYYKEKATKIVDFIKKEMRE